MSESPAGSRRSVAAGTISLLSARFAVAALAMIFIAVSTRLLTLREMAVFAVYNSLCVIQAIVSSLGLLTACARDLPALMGKGDLDGATRMLRTTLATNAAISAVVAAALAAAAEPLSVLFLKDAAFAGPLRWVAPAVFLWNLYEANQIALLALQRFGAYGRANILCAIAQRAISLTAFALLHRTGHGLVAYIAGYGAGTLVGIAANARAMQDVLRRPAGLAPLGPLVRHAAPFYADGWFRWLYMQADQVLIGIFLQPEVLSLYFVAKRFVQYYQQIVASAIDPVLAKVAEIRTRGGDAVERSLRAASRYFTLLFLPFSAATAALSVFFLDLAGGSPYRPGAPILALLSLSVAVYAAFNLVTGYVYVLGVPSDRLKHNVVAGGAQLVMMAALLAGVTRAGAGPIAASTAIVAARIAALLIGLAYAHVQLRRRTAARYDLSAIAPSLLASLALAAAIALPQRLLYHPAVIPLYAVAGAALAVLALRPAVREEDLRLLGDLLRGRAAGLERLARRLFPGAAAGSSTTA